jgi:hypothetical protein
LLASAAAAAIFMAPTACSRLRDRPDSNLLIVLLTKEDTLYAPSYSEARFSRIAEGMTRAEVERLLGEPLRTVVVSGGRIKKMIDSADGQRTSYPDLPPGSSPPITEIISYYTLPTGSQADWYVRTVAFTPEGRVARTTKDFHRD